MRVVNLRVSYQANVRRRESEEFYTRHQDAQDDHASMRAEIEVLRRESSETRQALARSAAHNRVLEARIATIETQLYRLEWQRQDADDHATRAMMLIHVQEDRALIDTLEDTDNRVADALAEIEANRTSRNGDDNHDSGTGSRRTERAARECTYTDFLKCHPLNFIGTEGVVGLTQWTVGHNVAYAMTWKTLKKMMINKYCLRGEIKKLEIELMFPEESDEVEKYVGGLPDMIQGSVMASKPKKMHDAIEFATELVDQKIRTLAERQAEKQKEV
ncbi:hypothetical protein Tco_1266193 [Tanacetum coccineum]